MSKRFHLIRLGLVSAVINSSIACAAGFAIMPAVPLSARPYPSFCMRRMTTGDHIITIVVNQENAALHRAHGFADADCGNKLSDVSLTRSSVCQIANTPIEAVRNDFIRIYGVDPRQYCSELTEFGLQ